MTPHKSADPLWGSSGVWGLFFAFCFPSPFPFPPGPNFYDEPLAGGRGGGGDKLSCFQGSPIPNAQSGGATFSGVDWILWNALCETQIVDFCVGFVGVPFWGDVPREMLVLVFVCTMKFKGADCESAHQRAIREP